MKRSIAALATLALVACKAEPKAPADEAPTTAVKKTAPALPETPKKPVSDDFHGVTVTEDYRWLENWDDPAVKAWSKAQNEVARAHLDDLPQREKVHAELSDILKKQGPSYRSVTLIGGKVFAKILEPPKQQPYLAVVKSLEDVSNPHVLVDPNTGDAKGTTSIDWYVPSPDGRLVAVSISKGGTESGDVSIFDVETKKKVFETIERVQGGTAGGDLAWTPDAKGFFYTRYPREGERSKEDMNFYQQLYLHRLGEDPAKDEYVLGKDLPKIAEIRVRVHGPTARLLVTVQKGDGGEFELYLREADGKIEKFSEFGDKIIAAPSARRTTCTCCRARVRRAGRSCASRSRSSIRARGRRSSPRARTRSSRTSGGRRASA